MEPAGLISDSNWSSFAFEESEFMSQLFFNYPCSNLQEFDSNSDVPASLSWYTSTSHEDSTINNIMQEIGKGGETKFNANSSLYSNSTTWPHDVSNTSLGDSDYVNGDSSGCSFINVFPGEEPNACSVDLFIMLNEEDHNKGGANDNYFGESNLNASELQVVPTTGHTSPKRKLLTPEADQPKVDDHSGNNQTEYPKKKARVSRHVPRNPRIGQAKKTLKVPATAISADEEGNMVTSPNGQSSSSYSEDDSNASEETHGVASSSSKGCKALNLNGKTRANRGSATDPQSLYARKRRERINERLRILQNLVPNGTKVDISTMLEEAVQYVKFLQLQIKLLSSDDLWMYAPIAYNGMDLGLDLKISPPQ